MDNSHDSSTLWSKVSKVLDQENFALMASVYDRRPLIQMANALGGPTMQLIHWKMLDDLKRIPHSREQRTVEAIDGINSFGAPNVELFMVSHRWLRPSRDESQAHPDCQENEKAKAINQFSQWRRKWVEYQHGFTPEIFYWIDYCCIDQDNPESAVAMIPLWISCCERFLRFETPDYHDRAWCRLEPLLSYVFSFADHQMIIESGFKFKWPYFGNPVDSVLLDPITGQLTVPDDIRHIRTLVQLASEKQLANSNLVDVSLGQTKVKCYKL